jgi:hypothetical protein
MIVNSDERQWTWMDERFKLFYGVYGGTELGQIFLLDVVLQKHCSLYEWRSKFLEPIMSN